MSNAHIIFFGIAFFGLTILAFILTMIEFYNMDKHPEIYQNPRYKKKTSKKRTKI